MKRNWSIFAVLMLFGAASFVQAADKLESYKKSREEFQQAERAIAKKQTSSDSAQKEIDRLAEQKALWERELVFYKGKLSNAQTQLQAFSNSGAAEEIDKWKREVTVNEARVKTAEQELAKVDEQTRTAIRNLQQSLKEGFDSNLILPGESIEVMVMEDDSFNGVYQIRRGGYIVMPRVGRISVTGKDLAGAEKAIKEALQQNQVKDATVMVERPENMAGGNGPVIYLAGEFLHPGPWKIPQGVSPTVVTTVLRSGGVTEAADLTHVRILRLVSGQPLVEEVNVQAILDGNGLPSDLSLNPGDIVMLPAFANVVYVTGNVVKPGQLRLLPDDELTAYSAILRAGGFARFANKSKVFVLRDRGNGAKQKIPVSIKEVQKGAGSDLILEPKDIVVVPEKFFSF
jgi:protein involved in polysaccharide export with SLBB domain